MTTSPIRPTDDQARALARQLLQGAKYASLGVLDPPTQVPFVSRIALGLAPEGHPITLISTLARHTQALEKDQRCSVLVGEPPEKGDPLAFPRMTLSANARFVAHSDPRHDILKQHYLQDHPKAQLYVDFADFRFVEFDVTAASLNGGFGKAYELAADDLK